MLFIVMGVIGFLGYYFYLAHHALHWIQRRARRSCGRRSARDGFAFADSHILNMVLFTPLIGAMVILFIPRERADMHRLVGNLFGLLGVLVSLPLIWRFTCIPARRDFSLSANRELDSVHRRALHAGDRRDEFADGDADDGARRDCDFVFVDRRSTSARRNITFCCCSCCRRACWAFSCRSISCCSTCSGK